MRKITDKEIKECILLVEMSKGPEEFGISFEQFKSIVAPERSPFENDEQYCIRIFAWGMSVGILISKVKENDKKS